MFFSSCSFLHFCQYESVWFRLSWDYFLCNINLLKICVTLISVDSPNRTCNNFEEVRPYRFKTTHISLLTIIYQKFITKFVTIIERKSLWNSVKYTATKWKLFLIYYLKRPKAQLLTKKSIMFQEFKLGWELTFYQHN